MKYVLAIDVAKFKSMYLLMNSFGEVLIAPIELDHILSSFDFIYQKILELNILDNLTIVMESTSIYHKQVQRYFLSKNLNTIVYNAMLSKQNTKTLRKTKTDKQDCFNIADLFFKGDIPNNNLDINDLYSNLNELHRQLQSLEQGLTRYKNRYRDLCHLCFPEFELCFKGPTIYNITALNFIKEFPHAEIIKDKRIDALAHNMANTQKRHLNHYKKKATLIKQFANNSFPGISSNSMDVDNLKQMANVIIFETEQINLIKEKMIALAKQSSLFIPINSLFGIGEFTASQILAELRDITRFKNIKQINAFCGLDPIINQSGKSLNHRGPISKRGNKFARKVLFNVCCNIIQTSSKSQPDNPIYLYYLKKKVENKHFYERIIACETKLIRILFAVCKQSLLDQL